MDAATQRQKDTEKRKDEKPSGGEKVKVKDNVVSMFFSSASIDAWLVMKV